MMTDISAVRQEFPILTRTVHGKPLVYLDNAATTLSPTVVQERMVSYYKTCTANIHRGVHYLSEEATRQFEDTRKKVQTFINAAEPSEIVFTSGTTMSINFVAQSFGQRYLRRGDEIIISEMEHHSNIVPWQMLCQQRGCVLKFIPLTPTGELDFEKFYPLLSPRTKIIAVVHVSNSLGTINPLPEIIRHARQRDIAVLVDAAQAVSHFTIDVQKLDCDFLSFSAHKLFGPTGVGVLYGKKRFLTEMPPAFGGGGMITRVTMQRSTYLETPDKFEGGTPNIAGVLGLDTAIDYFMGIDQNAVQRIDKELLEYATAELNTIKGLRIIGTATRKVGIISFILDGVHPHDLGTLLDHEGVAIRTGHHCTQPTMTYFKIPATARASFTFYNTREEIDTLIGAVHKAVRFFT